jgi:UDPglucose 6-dehydrogenase
MIGIIGFGMVGKAVAYGFDRVDQMIVDPAYNSNTIKDLCDNNPEVIFVCVPTPTDDTNYGTLKGVLLELLLLNYAGIVVVKSTVLPEHLVGFDVVYNPEFLSRATSNNDFINPPMVIIGCDDLNKAYRVADIYRKYSKVNMDCIKFMDLKTACLTKYTMNSFYALKVTYMNAIYDIANNTGADYKVLVDALKMQPWMGTHHFDVPGPDGDRGFGGPCLPKDTQAFTNRFGIKLLDTALELNSLYRTKKDT